MTWAEATEKILESLCALVAIAIIFAPLWLPFVVVIAGMFRKNRTDE